MTYLLFPGRHLLTTTFQEQYLRRVLQKPIRQLRFLDADNAPALPPLDSIIFAVTSCNQQHARYNPIPFFVRAIGIDRFARPLERSLGVDYRILGIPHFRRTPRFAEFVLKEIEAQTEGSLQLTPKNCIVLCCTPGVNAMYRALGFHILPAEAGESPKPDTPFDLLRQLVGAGDRWMEDEALRQKLSPASFELWQDFPDVPRRVLRLWNDPLLNEDGGLTGDRDYASYAYGMGNQEIIQLKYRDIKESIVPGKIVDEGCADGALLEQIARDYPDSDLIGIEITGEFMARALERQRAGAFGGSYVHFHQRNITQKIFVDGSVDTTICNSTLHELWSYGDGAATVDRYLRNKYLQTAPGGRLIIRDVVGPTGRLEEVYLWCSPDDGRSGPIFRDFDDPAELARHLAALSTYARFKRFARDFRAEQRAADQPAFVYREQQVGNRSFFVLRLQDAAEFLSKKDYVNNWTSEMHEEFAFWSYAEWKAAVHRAGFDVIEAPFATAPGSRVYTNPWIVTNRWENHVQLFGMDSSGQLTPRPFPETNVILVGERRDS